MLVIIIVLAVILLVLLVRPARKPAPDRRERDRRTAGDTATAAIDDSPAGTSDFTPGGGDFGGAGSSSSWDDGGDGGDGGD